jgi:phosphoserine aminotransferase
VKKKNGTRTIISPLQTNPDHDILFTFNGTTSGVRVPNLDWISNDRKGLTFNDATSAAFAMNIGTNHTLISVEIISPSPSSKELSH